MTASEDCHTDNTALSSHSDEYESDFEPPTSSVYQSEKESSIHDSESEKESVECGSTGE